MRPLPHRCCAGSAGCLAVLAVLCAAGCAPESVLPEPGPAAASDWTLVTPRPFDIHVTDLWGPSPDRMFAVGLFGGLLVREGGTWRAAPAPTTSHLWDVHGCDWEHVYAVSEEGLLRFDGKRWRREGPADLDQESRVFCIAPDDVMVVTRDRSAHHWDGRAWTSHRLDLVPYQEPGEWLAGAPDGTYLAAGERGRFAFWTGGAWRAQEPESSSGYGIRAVAYHAATQQWLGAGYSGNVWLGVLRDGSWDEISSRSGGRFADLAVGAAPHVARLSTAGGIGITNPGRPDILVAGRPLRLALCAFATGYADNDFLVAAGSFGLLLEGFAAEDTLESRSVSTTFSAEGFHVWPDGDFAAWSNDNRVLVSRGGVLTIAGMPAAGRIVGAWGPRADLVYVAGRNGELYLLRDGTQLETLAGRNDEMYNYVLGGYGEEPWASGWDGIARWNGQLWERVPWPFAGPGASRLAVRADGDVWAMSDGDLGRWDGTAWHADGPAGALSYHALVRDRATDDLLVIARVREGGPREVLRFHDGQWRNLGHPGDPASRVCPGPDGEVWVTAYGGFHVWRDGVWSRAGHPGEDWSLVSGYTSGGDAEGGIYVSRLTGGIYHLDLGGLGLWR